MEELPINDVEDVREDIRIQISVDGTGRVIYRHIIYTEWAIVPSE